MLTFIAIWFGSDVVWLPALWWLVRTAPLDESYPQDGGN